VTDTTADTTSARPLATADDPVAAAIATMAPDILNRLNADFEDAVLLIGRVLADRPGATAAEVVAVDRRGTTSSYATATAPTRCAWTSRARSPSRPSSPPSCSRS
jgi:hypothetical protein